MPALNQEIELVQNPAFGSLLEWRFVVGYSEERADASGCPLPLIFLPLPLVLHASTLAIVEGTRVGLRGFAAKFADGKGENDVLLSVHERARVMRPLSLDSLRMGIASRLIHVDPDTGLLHALTRTMPKGRLADEARLASRNAEKLGRWCAGLTLLEIASILRVRF
jgi:hypothetical protein